MSVAASQAGCPPSRERVRASGQPKGGAAETIDASLPFLGADGYAARPRQRPTGTGAEVRPSGLRRWARHATLAPFGPPRLDAFGADARIRSWTRRRTRRSFWL